MNIALILSGGIGSRLGADVPKQYIEVGGKRIIDYCIETFEKCKNIDAIQIVADEVWREVIVSTPMKKLAGFSVPGATRQLSILNGLESIGEYATESDIVIVHDAARPLVSKALIEDLIVTVKEHDGVMPVLPMKDTVYYSKDGKVVTSLLERKCIYAGQAPESFVFGKYYQANLDLLPDKILKVNGSTEPAVLAGLDIAMVSGEEKNFKITTKADLQRFEDLIAEK